MSSGPQVTICIPTWQAQDFIQRTMQCAAEQTIENIRILVSIDKCDDRTAEICDEFSRHDSRVEVFTHSERLGWAGNCNFLLDKVSTDYFFLYFHDDIIAPTYCERLLAEFEKHDDISSVHCSMGHFGGGDHISVGSDYLGSASERLIRFLVSPTKGSPLRSLIKKEALEKGLRFPGAEHGGFWSNQPFLLKLFSLGQAIHVREVLYQRWDKRAGGLTDGWAKRSLLESVQGFRANAAYCLKIIEASVTDPMQREVVIYCLQLFIMISVRQVQRQWKTYPILPNAICPVFTYTFVPVSVTNFSEEIQQWIKQVQVYLWNFEGLLATEINHYSLAKEKFSLALEVDPESPEARSGLANLPV